MTTTKFGLAQPVRRVEDPRLLKGAGRYTDDIVLPGMLFGVVLRSPHAAATITRLARVSGSVIRISSRRLEIAALSPIEDVMPSLQESVPGHETTSLIVSGPGSPRSSAESACQTS